jgi:hypothetical protein
VDDVVAAPFLLARRYAVGERFILGPGGDAEPALRRAVSSGGGREFPADRRYRVLPYDPGHHAVYREIELTAVDLGVPGPVRDEHGRTILAIEGLAVTGDPFRIDAADLAAAHKRVLSHYADLWRAERKPQPPVPLPPRPHAPEPAPTRPSVWIWVIPLVLALVVVLLIALS